MCEKQENSMEISAKCGNPNCDYSVDYAIRPGINGFYDLPASLCPECFCMLMKESGTKPPKMIREEVENVDRQVKEEAERPAGADSDGQGGTDQEVQGDIQ